MLRPMGNAVRSKVEKKLLQLMSILGASSSSSRFDEEENSIRRRQKSLRVFFYSKKLKLRWKSFALDKPITFRDIFYLEENFSGSLRAHGKFVRRPTLLHDLFAVPHSCMICSP